MKSQELGGTSMKKLWLLLIPVGLAAIFFSAQAVQSFGFRGHRHGMAKEFLEYRLDKLSKELNLNENQKAKLDTFKADIETVMDQRKEKHEEIHQIVKEELSKDNPDFNKIRPIIDEQIDSMAQIAHQFVGKIDEFYADLTPEQKKLLRDHIVEKMEDHDHWD
jgi:Spy/CpxP family protein refolding chaperone